ncbi:MAG: hypothetical protein IJZ63_04510, partial [Clostridia bacterium]|nr:hypothetical protein [Clostridia bacterium]
MSSKSGINITGLKTGALAGALAAKSAIADKSDKTKIKNSKTNIKFSDNIGKLSSLDTIAREKGFENYDELLKYKAKNPHTYAVMGGYYYEPDNFKSNYTPLNEEGKFVVTEAQKRDSYIRNLQYVMDKEDAKRARNKRYRGINLTDREIEAEINLQWLNGSVNSNEIVKKKEKAKAVNNAVIKFNNGEEINSDELLLLTENGGANFTNGDIYETIDFLANDNPKNISAEEKYKKAVDKERKGEKLTAQEKADKSNYIARREIRKSIIKDKFTFSADTKKNAENLNTIAATQMYNDAIYEKGIKKTFAQMDLYVNTGMTKFFQDTINTGTILMTELDYNSGLGDKRASDVLKQIPASKYEIA